MPLTRYQIRDEYSLADPELYKAADKDDPEALLEGVAMAGLVGVLRQLGDLAEFAAEIFHDLHEEVMATAARGHSLTIRVQQLEADFPSIEKAFLSQTSHSSLFYSPGAEWHPNMRMDQNLISQGDMPRFVMDSYEESRGPPRLFLLDKFDVAGAGACLKRYTDPSFFKVDSSSLKITNAELHREKKIRKAKKKASRWRNRETPEVQPTSHAKLHQLFLEESVENHINNPSCRVKLKRRLNEFPFDPKTKGSYMGKFLASLTPNHEVGRDIVIDSKPMKLPSHITGKSRIEIHNISTVASDEELLQIMGNPCSSSDAEDNGRELSAKELKEDMHYEFVEASKLKCISESNDRLSQHHDEVKEKEVEVDAQSKLEDSFDGYPSDADDIASEVENYVDALTTMDSEIETDNELRAKNRAYSLNSGNQGIDSDENENNFQRRSSESTSLGSSTGSDEINSAPKNDYPQSNSSHDLIEDTLFCGDVSGKTPPNEPCNTQIDNVPSDPVYEESQFAENGVCNEDDTRRHGSESGNTSCGGSLTDSTPVTLPVDSGKPFSEDASAGPELEEISSEFKELGAGRANVVELKIDAGDCVACQSDHSNSTSQSIDGFLHEVSSENQSVNDSDDEVPPILDNASLLPSNISDLAPEEGTESLSGNVLLVEELEEEQVALVSPTNSLHSVSLQTEEEQHLSSDLPETCLPDKGPNGGGPEVDDSSLLPSDIAVSSSSLVSSPKAMDLASLQSNENPEDVVPCDSALEIPYCGGENRGGASSASDEVGRFSLDIDSEVKDDADLQFSSDLQESPDSPSIPNVHQENVTTNTVDPEVTAASTVSRNHSGVTEDTEEDSASGSPQLLDDSVSSLQDSCQREVEISNTSSPDHLQESLLLKEAHQQPTLSELDFALDNAGCSDGNIDQRSLSPYHPEFVEECSSTVQDVLVSGSEIDEESLPMNIREPLVPEVVDQPEATPSDSDYALYNSPESPNGIPSTFEIEPPSNQQHQDSELNSFQPVIVDENAEDAVSSPSDHIISELKLPSEEKVELEDQFDTGSRQEMEFSEYESTQQMNATDSNTELRIPPEELVEVSDAQLDVELWHEQKVSESEYTQHMGVADGKENTVTSPTSCAPEPRFPSELKELQEQEFHVISRHDDNLNSESVHLEEKVQSPSHFNMEKSTDVLSESSAAYLSTKPLVFEHFDSKEQVENTSISVKTFSLFPEVSHIELDEMPPLPPLPPMQWRMGKVQNASLASERDLTSHNLSSIRHEQVQVGHLQVNPNLASFSENETLQHGHENVLGSMVHASPSVQVPNTINHKNSDNGFPSFGESHISNQLLVQPTVDNESSGSGYLVSGGEETSKHNENGEDVGPTHTPGSLQEKLAQPVDQLLDRESSEAEKPREIIIISEGIGINRPDATSLPIAAVDDDQTQHSLSTTEGQHVWSLSMSYPLPSNGDGNKPMRLPRPRSPLIDAVAAHDKSKLRKVTERVRPRSEQEVDERDSLLEQIRAKSFNLKPAVVTRPSIQGPKTNLRVAAILEKANAIRQAFAGSDDDEDDEDSWSES